MLIRSRSKPLSQLRTQPDQFRGLLRLVHNWPKNSLL